MENVKVNAGRKTVVKDNMTGTLINVIILKNKIKVKQKHFAIF